MLSICRLAHHCNNKCIYTSTYLYSLNFLRACTGLNAFDRDMFARDHTVYMDPEGMPVCVTGHLHHMLVHMVIFCERGGARTQLLRFYVN